MKNKKVLVTGATGFLGQYLVKSLIEQENDVTILVRKSSDLSPFAGSEVKVVYGDITDRLLLLQATQGIHSLYHLAGIIAYKRKQRESMNRVNVQGTGNVLDACITNKVSKVLYVSSVATIGASLRPEPLDEDSPFLLSKHNLGYFETKRKAEEMALRAYKENQLPVYLINPATIYGAGDASKGTRKTQVKVARGEFKLYPPGGVNVVYVKDVVKAIQACLEKGQPGRRYIIGGENMTIKELFGQIAQAAGQTAPPIPIPRFFLSSLGLFGDGLTWLGKETSLSTETAVMASYYHWFKNDRAQKELGFQPTPASQAISESVSWMKTQGLLN